MPVRVTMVFLRTGDMPVYGMSADSGADPAPPLKCPVPTGEVFI